MKTTWLGFAGRKNHGKTTAQEHLDYWLRGRREEFDTLLVNFATPLKLGLLEMFPFIPRSILTATDAEKDAIIPELGVSWRHLCQTLGDDWGREMVNKDVWVIVTKWKLDKLLKDSHRHTILIFGDVRYQNEVDIVNKFGGSVLRVKRTMQNYDSHRSETSVDSLTGVRDIINDGTRDQYLAKLDAYFAEILLR